MPIYQVANKELKAVMPTTFGAEGILERKDLQRMLRENIAVLDPRLMVIAEEFGDWIDSLRRIADHAVCGHGVDNIVSGQE